MRRIRPFGIGALAALFALAAQAADTQPTVEKCPRELGTLAVAEPQAHVTSGLSRYGLGSPSTMLRMIVQQSGCFTVVERGVAMQNLQQERALAAGGQLQADSNIGGGQLQAADFVMTPVVQFAAETGGVGGTIGGLMGRAGGLIGSLGALAGGVKFKEAETSLLVADVRSGIQVASAEGNASKMDFSLGGWGWGGLGWAAGGGYSKSPEGRLIAASLLDNYNKIVLNVRDRPQLVRARSEASVANAAQSTAATPQNLTTTAVVQPAMVAAPVAVAPRVVAVAPQVVVAPQVIVTGTDVVLPTSLIGTFSGEFAGGHSGVMSLLVSVNGRINGVVQSAAAGGSVPVQGAAQADGTFVMIGSNQGATAQFSGRIDPQSGAMIGTWMLVGQNVQGTFSGKRN